MKKHTLYPICIALLSTMLLPAQENNCLHIGNGHLVSLPTNNLSLGTDDFTLEAWVNGVEDDFPSHGTILSNRKSSPTGIRGILLGFHNYWGGSHKVLFLQMNGGTNHLFVNNGNLNGPILDGQCHHIAVVREANTVTMYVDGKVIGTKGILPELNVDTDGPFWVGRDAWSINQFVGSISEVRIWNVARTYEQINNTMPGSIVSPVPNLVGNWSMREGTGQYVWDAAGGNHGTLGTNDEVNPSDPLWGHYCCAAGIVTHADDAALPEEVPMIVGPNPTPGHIQVNLGRMTGFVDAVLYNTLGQLVQRMRFENTDVFQFDIPAAAGLYVLTLQVRGKTTAVKIVKQ